MTKNEIVKSVVDGLVSQRSFLSKELREINYNEASAIEKKTTIESSIVNLDAQLSMYIINIPQEPI